MTDLLVELWRLTPAQSGPPTREVAAPLHSWTSLSIEDELSRDGRLDLSVPVDQLDADARPLLADPLRNPCEVTVTRNGHTIHAGPVWTVGLQGGTVSIHCKGLLGWLRFAVIGQLTGDLDLEDTDQHQVVVDLIDAWQTLDYAHYGIDTTAVTSAGKTRTRRYPASQQREVYDAITRLADQWDLDVAVDPASRELQLWTPERSRDRTGEFWIDDANLDSADEQRTVAAGEVASYVDAISPADDEDTDDLTATAVDQQLRAEAFLRAHALSERDLSVQSTLDDRAQAALEARDHVGWQPGPALSVVIDRDWDDVEPGDLVTYDFDAGLGRRTDTVRVVKRALSIDADGAETMSVEVA